MTMKINDFIPYFETPSTAATLNQKMGIFSTLAISYIKMKLEQGFDIPLPKEFIGHIKNPTVVAKKGYLYVDGVPNFEFIVNRIVKMEDGQLAAILDEIQQLVN